ncbi:FtsX-like permease family protein [Lacticaseibacillus sp. GG6-2]
MWQLTRADLKRHQGMRRELIGIIALLVAMLYAVAALIESHGLIRGLTADDTTTGILPAMLVVVLVVMMLFTVVFLVYLNNLLLVRREEEFGLYRRLGMPAGRLGLSLSLEVAYSGIVGLVLGLVGGILLSKLLAMVLLRLVDVAEPVGVLFSPVAIGEVTGFIALLIVLLAALRSLAVRGKNLTHYWQHRHQAATPPVSGALAWIGAIAAVVLLVGANVVIFQLFAWTSRFARWFGDFVGLGSLGLLLMIAELLGVYLLYACLLPLVISGLLKRRFAQLATRYLLLTHIDNRLRQNTQSLWLTTWLTTVTLVMLGSAAMLYQFGQATVNQNIAQPVLVTSAAQPQVAKLLAKDTPQVRLPTKLAAGRVKLKMRNAADQEERGLYQVITLSAYDRIRQTQPQLPAVHLQGRQAALLTIGKTYYQAQAFGRWSNIGRQLTLTAHGEKFTIAQLSNAFPLGSAGFFDRGLVVTDAAYARLQAPTDTLVGYWPKKKQRPAIDRRLGKIDVQEYAALDKKTLAGVQPVRITTHEQAAALERDGVSLRKPALHQMRVVFGFLLFAMMLLGAVFMVATASILLLKQLAAAQNEQGNRRILRRLGMPEADLVRVRDRQVLAVFGLPLVVGGINAAGGLRLLEVVLDSPAKGSVGIAFGAYAIVYLAFAVLTASHSDRT